MPRNRRTSSSLATALVVAALLPQCASTPRPSAAPVPPPPAATAVSTEVEVDVDTSPVERPSTAVLTVRAASVLGAARRIGELLGMQQFAEEGVRSALPDILNDEGAAHAVDFEGGVDLVVATHANDVEGVASFAVRSLAAARAQLSDGHTLEAFGNPSFRLQRLVRPNAHGGDELILAPVPGTEGARLIMVHRRDGYEDFVNAYVPYLTRTLGAQPVSASDGVLVVDLHPQSIEAAFHGDLDRGIAQLVDQFAPGADPNNPAFADAARAWLRDALGAVRSSLHEARDARLALHIQDSGATISFDGAVQNPTAQFAQNVLAALHDAAPPTDLYERLPQGGAAYSAWSLHTEPLRATLNLAANAAARMLTPRSRLSDADATALRTALGALVAQDRVAVASTHARDAQDRYTATALLRVSTPSPQFVANVRTLVQTLRHPGIARAMRTDVHIDPALWSVPTSRQLPAGSLLVRGELPSLTALVGPGVLPGTAATPASAHPPATAAHPAAAPARPVISELLLVPEGDHVWVILAGNALAQYATATANHPAPPAIDGATTPGTASVALFYPRMLEELVRGDSTLLHMVHDALTRNAGAASAGSVGRLRVTERDGATHVGGDLVIPRAVLGLVGETVQRGLGRP